MAAISSPGSGGPPASPASGPSLPNPSLRRNFSWTLAGNVLYAGCQWGMLAVLTHLTSKAVVGSFGAGLAICGPAVLFTNLALRNVLATDARQQFAWHEYLSLRWLGVLAAALIIGGVVLMRGDAAPTAGVILLVGLSKLVEAMSDLTYGLFQQHERMDLVTRSLVLRGGLGSSAFAATIIGHGGLPLALVAMTTVWFGVMTRDVLNARRMVGLLAPKPLAWPRLKRLAVIAAPLGIAATMVSLNVNIPRLAVEAYLGADALGVFTSIGYFLVMISLVTVALGQATAPHLSRLWVAGDHRPFWRLVLLLSAAVGGLGVLAAGAALVIGPTVLRLAFGPTYASHDFLLAQVLLAVGIAGIGGILGVAVTAARAMRHLLPAHGVVTATTAVASYLLVPRYGLDGAGWVLVISGALTCVPPMVALALRDQSDLGGEPMLAEVGEEPP